MEPNASKDRLRRSAKLVVRAPKQQANNEFIPPNSTLQAVRSKPGLGLTAKNQEGTF